VLFPLKYTDTNHWVTLEIICCWILGIFIGFLPFVWHQTLPITRCYYHDVVTEGYQIFRLVFVIIIPFCVLCTIYVMIYRIILYQLKHENLFKPSFCCQTDSQSCIHLATRREIKVTINVFLIILFFIICWLPLNVIKVIKSLYPEKHIPDYLIAVGIILTHFNSALNPLMYAYHLKDFRQAICKLFACRRRASSEDY
jgi:7 transmembrane receptor (rhodopsin family)